MIITAKYASYCPVCNTTIAVGSKVEWERGEKARHVKCSPGTAPAAPKVRAKSPPREPRAPKYPSSAPETGAHEISGRRDGRGDVRYEVGQVLHAPKVSTPGGGPDGHYYVVLAHQLTRPNEDNGQYDWTEYAWVRSATDAEAATKAAVIRRANAPKLVMEYVVSQIRLGRSCGDADAVSLLQAAERMGGVVKVTSKDGTYSRILLAGIYVIGFHGGYYDDYRATARMCEATPVLEMAIRALASGKADDLAVTADAVMVESESRKTG